MARKLVVARHSEGSTVVARLAATSRRVTHLIYATGCPMGCMMTMVQQARADETDADSTRYGDETFAEWATTVACRTSRDVLAGDTYKTTYDFSIPPIEYLRKLKIPVLVSYGTKDWGAPFKDYLCVEIIRRSQTNFTFQAHLGLDHNFFPLKPDGAPDYDTYHWPAVGLEWLRWARK